MALCLLRLDSRAWSVQRLPARLVTTPQTVHSFTPESSMRRTARSIRLRCYVSRSPRTPAKSGRGRRVGRSPAQGASRSRSHTRRARSAGRLAEWTRGPGSGQTPSGTAVERSRRMSRASVDALDGTPAAMVEHVGSFGDSEAGGWRCRNHRIHREGHGEAAVMCGCVDHRHEPFPVNDLELAGVDEAISKARHREAPVGSG